MTDLVKLPSCDCHWSSLMICQYWFRWWLGAVRPQTNIYAKADQEPRRRMASLGHNQLATLKPRLNRRHFADDIFKFIISLNGKCCRLIQMPLEFGFKGPVNNIYIYIYTNNDTFNDFAPSCDKPFLSRFIYLKLWQFAMPETCESWLVKLYLLCPRYMWKLEHVAGAIKWSSIHAYITWC